jgi:hypothetical protein
MNKENFIKLIEDLKGFGEAEKKLLISSYELGYVAGSRAMQESIWADELHSYNAISGRRFDA